MPSPLICAFAVALMAGCGPAQSPSQPPSQSSLPPAQAQQPSLGGGLLTVAMDQQHPQGIISVAGRRLTDNGSSASWTPDGRILFVRGGQIWIMDGDGRNSRQYGKINANPGGPAWPQMGRNGIVVFQIMRGTNTLWALDSEAAKPRQLVPQLADAGMPSLAASGSWLAFMSETSDHHRAIWRVNVDGSGLRQLTDASDAQYPDANAPSVSPDEQAIAFFTGLEGENSPDPAKWGYRNVGVMTADGAARRIVTDCKPVTVGGGSCIAADNPAWMPDGSAILVDTDKGGTWTVPAAGGTPTMFNALSRGPAKVSIR